MLKLLFVTILAAIFYNFCKRVISVLLAQLHTEQQYRKLASTMLVYIIIIIIIIKFFKVGCTYI